MPRVLRYKLDRPCGLVRGMSLKCTTTFALQSGGAIECPSIPPSTICLTPGHAVLRPPIPCVRCKDNITPSAYLIVLYWDSGVRGPYLAEQIGACGYQGGVYGDLIVSLGLSTEVPDPEIAESAHGLSVSTYPVIGVSFGVGLYRNWQNVLTSEEGCRQVLYFDYHDPIWLGTGTAIAVPLFYDE